MMMFSVFVFCLCLTSIVSIDIKPDAEKICWEAVRGNEKVRFNAFLKAAFQATKEAVDKKILSNKPGGKGSDLNHAHVVPWKSIIDRILATFPNTDADYNRMIGGWKTDMRKMTDDLHIIDQEWYLHDTFEKFVNKKGKRPYLDYAKNNDENKGLCRLKVDNIPNVFGDTDAIKKNLGEFCNCAYNSPANIRPGFKDTNEDIGGWMDPLVPQGEDMSQPGKFTKFTSHAADLKREFNTVPKYYDASIGGGYKTSDVPLIVTADYTTKFDEIVLPDDIDIDLDFENVH